jgi:hypothetical protein
MVNYIRYESIVSIVRISCPRCAINTRRPPTVMKIPDEMRQKLKMELIKKEEEGIINGI